MAGNTDDFDTDYIAVLGILFLIFFCFIWIILFSFRPIKVRYIEEGEIEPRENSKADPARCFVGSLIFSIVIIIIIWMCKNCRL